MVGEICGVREDMGDVGNILDLSAVFRGRKTIGTEMGEDEVSEVSSATGVGPMTTLELGSKARDLSGVFRGRNRGNGALEELSLRVRGPGTLEMESVDRSGKVFALSVVFLGLMKEGDEGGVQLPSQYHHL